MSRALFPVIVHVLLIRQIDGRRELYLQRRCGTGVLDGYFAPPGGHLEPDELPSAAAARELSEEAGVAGLALTPWGVLPYATRRGSGINLLFCHELATPEAVAAVVPIIAEPAAADLAVWADVSALPQPVPGWIRDALALAPAGSWYGEIG